MRRDRRRSNLSGEQVLLLKRMESELTLRGYARRTQKSYVGYCRRFLQWKRDFQGDTQSAMRSYPEWLIAKMRISHATINSAYSALSFLRTIRDPI